MDIEIELNWVKIELKLNSIQLHWNSIGYTFSKASQGKAGVIPTSAGGRGEGNTPLERGGWTLSKGLELRPKGRRIFDGFWAQVGGQVGAKLAPKSEEKGYQDDVKKSSKIWRRKGTRVDAGHRSAGP